MKPINEDKTYFEVHGEELLKRMGISKTAFGDKMGVKKQNVNSLFSTKNIAVLRKAAQVLDIPFETLIANADGKKPVSIIGFVEIEGKVYKIQSKQDLEHIIGVLKEAEVKIFTPKN